MKIVAARHWLLHVPFMQDVVWGGGRRSGTTRLVVELTTESGIVGYGETICLLDFIEPVLAKVVLPLVIGKPISDVERLHRHVLGAGYYHHKRAAVMAMTAVEMAMWDALGKVAGVPLHALWGGRFRDTVPVCGFLASAAPDVMRGRTKEFMDRGYTSFKVKLGLDERSDIEVVRAARETMGDAGNLRADVNGGWTIGTAKRQLEKLREFDLTFIEQPLELSDLEGHAHLRLCQPIPVALDESAYDLTDVGTIVRAEAADIVLLDPHEAGGLWQCIKAAGLCEATGIAVTMHSGGELGLSQAALIHLAASIPNCTIPMDCEYPYLAGDIITKRHEVRDSAMAIPNGPGLGVEVDLDQLERYSVTSVPPAYLDSDRPDWFTVKPSY